MEHYEVSVVVLTYKPNKEKLLETLQSILMQTDVRMQIVIADDGSAEPQFTVAEQFFLEHNFTDYVIVDNKENRGTVYNVQSGIDRSTGDYIKLISPGDMLADNTVLRRWLAALRSSNAEVSFCDALYYVPGENGMTPVSRPTHPMNISCYRSGSMQKIRYHYLILNDLILGAATLGRRDIMKKYIDEIAGKVRYAEDHIYWLMTYDSIPLFYFPEPAVLYETSTGISTSGNDFWKQKLLEDWNATKSLVVSRCTGSDPIDRKLKRLDSLPKNVIGKALKYVYCPGMLFFKFKKKFFPRMSSLTLPQSK